VVFQGAESAWGGLACANTSLGTSSASDAETVATTRCVGGFKRSSLPLNALLVAETNLCSLRSARKIFLGKQVWGKRIGKGVEERRR
jgi:hypothetical protein